jgi:diguanylate cyclase (GGDEF)-like protein
MDGEIAMGGTPVPLRRSRPILYLYGVVIVVAIVTMALTLLVYLRQQVTLNLEENTQSIARTLELTFNAQIDAIDVGLIAAKRELERQNSSDQPHSQSINSYLHLITASLPNTEIIRATNAAGDIIYGSDSPTALVNIADRDYFQQLKGDPSAGLLVLNPVIGRLDKKWGWSFVRRLNKLDGSFNGVVYARLDIPRIEAMFMQVKLVSSGIIALRDKDLGLIARYRFDGGNTIPTGDKKLSVGFLEVLKTHPVEGTYTALGDNSIDGVSRLYSYRVSQKYGFVISDGLDMGVAFSYWRTQAYVTVALVALLAVMVAFIVSLIQKSWVSEELVASNLAKIDLQMRLIAFFDPLTQLPNRRLLKDRLSQAIATSKRTRGFGALMFLDLDNFKALNDVHGHEFGDLLLVEASKRISQCVRAVDTVSRFGGDEFVVLLNDLGSEQDLAIQAATQVAEKIRAALGQPYSLCVEHQEHAPAVVEHRCTASIGVTLFVGDGMADDIVQRADVAMYQAKEVGRNCVRLYANDAIELL